MQRLRCVCALVIALGAIWGCSGGAKTVDHPIDGSVVDAADTADAGIDAENSVDSALFDDGSTAIADAEPPPPATLGEETLALYTLRAETNLSNCWRSGADAGATPPVGMRPCPWLAETQPTSTYLAPTGNGVTDAPTTVEPDPTNPALAKGRYLEDPDPATIGGDRDRATAGHQVTGPEVTLCAGQPITHNPRNGQAVAKVLRPAGGGLFFPTRALNQESGTVAMWIKMGVHNGWNSTFLYHFALPGSDTLYKPIGWPNSLMFYNQRAEALSATLPADGTWHHVVGTWSGNLASIYLDGAYVGVSQSKSPRWLSALTPELLIGAVGGQGCSPNTPPCDRLYLKEAILLNRTVNDDEAKALCTAGRSALIPNPAPRRVTATLAGSLRTVSTESVCSATRTAERRFDASISLRGATPTDFGATSGAKLWRGHFVVESQTANGGWAASTNCDRTVDLNSFSEHVSLPTSCVLSPTGTHRIRLTEITDNAGRNWPFAGGIGASFVSQTTWLDGPVAAGPNPDLAYPREACDRVATPPHPWGAIATAPGTQVLVGVSTTDPIGLGNRLYDWMLGSTAQLFPTRISATMRNAGPIQTGVQRELLASPIKLIANGEAATVQSATWLEKATDRVTFRSTGTAAGVAVEVDTKVDYDGEISTEISIPSGATSLRTLSLEFELPLKIATHLNTTTPDLRGAYYTHTSGELDTFLTQGKYQSGWGQQPLIWLGTPEGGLQITTSNTASWYGPEDKQISITRNSLGNVVVSLNFLQTTSPTSALKYSIGIIGTPVRGFDPGARDRELRVSGGRNLDGLHGPTWNSWDRIFIIDWNRPTETAPPRWGYRKQSDWTFYDLAQSGPCRDGGYSLAFSGTFRCKALKGLDDNFAANLAAYPDPWAQEYLGNQRYYYRNDVALIPRDPRDQFLYWDMGSVWRGDPALGVAGAEWGILPSPAGLSELDSTSNSPEIASQRDYFLGEEYRLLNSRITAPLPAQAGYADTTSIVNRPIHELIAGYYLDVTTAHHQRTVETSGRAVHNWTVEGTREFLRRFYQLNYALPQPKQRIIVNHNSDGPSASYLGFANMHITGEHQFAGYHYCIGNQIAHSYRDLLTPERLRAEYAGSRIGVETLFIPFFGSQVTIDPSCAPYLQAYAAGHAVEPGSYWFWSNGQANRPSDSYLDSEHLAGLLLAHDIGLWGINMNPFPFMRLSAVKDRFGWNDNAKFIGYWENSGGGTPFVSWSACGTDGCSTTSDRTKRFVSVYLQNGGSCVKKVLWVAINNSSVAAQFDLLPNWSALGLRMPTAPAGDPYSAPNLPFRPYWLPGNQLPAPPSALLPLPAAGTRFSVKPWNFRLIQTEASTLTCP